MFTIYYFRLLLSSASVANKRKYKTRALPGAIAGDVDPGAAAHHALHAADGMDVARGILAEDDKIRQFADLERPQVGGAAQGGGARLRRRRDCLQRCEPRLDQQFHLAPGRLSSAGERHAAVAAKGEAGAMLEGRQRERFHLRVALQADRGSLLAA